MNILFVSLPGMKVGGIPSYIARLMGGINKVGGNKVDIMTVSKGHVLTDVYKIAGVDNHNIIPVSTVDQALYTIQNYDWVIYDQMCGYNDLSYSKSHTDGLYPWYYYILFRNNGNVTAIIHTHLTYTRHNPYLSIWEDKCKFVFCYRSTTAEHYLKNGNLDVYMLDMPIDCDNMYMYADRIPDPIIVSTSRIDPIKRQHVLLKAIRQVGGLWWKAELYSGENVWYYLNEINKLAEDCGSISIDTSSKKLDYDTIYNNVALVYNATKYPPECWGGAESATLEGVVRGAVPLLSNEWVEPNPEAFPLDACYSFDANDIEGLANLIKSIKLDDDYIQRRANAMNFVQKTKSNRRIAEKLLHVLEHAK